MATVQAHRIVHEDTVNGLILPVLIEVGLDPCASEQSPVVAKKTYSGEVDGYTQPWHKIDHVWLFPPTRLEAVGAPHTLDQWVSKAYREYTRGATVLALLPPNTGSSWFHDFVTLSSAFTLVRKNYRLAGSTGDPVRQDRSQLTVLWTHDPVTKRRYCDISEAHGLLVENV